MMIDDIPANASFATMFDTVKACMTCVGLDDRARMDVQNYLFANTKTGYGEVMKILQDCALKKNIVNKSAYVTESLKHAPEGKSSSSSSRRA